MVAIGITDKEYIAVVVGIQDVLRSGGGEIISITPSRDIGIAEDIATAIGVYVRIAGVIAFPEDLVEEIGGGGGIGKWVVMCCPRTRDPQQSRQRRNTSQLPDLRTGSA